MATYEFISLACYSVITDKKLYKLADEYAQQTDLVFYDKNTGDIIPNDVALDVILSTGKAPWFKDTGCEGANDLFISASLLQAHGHTEQARKTLKHAHYLLFQHTTEPERLGNIEDILKSSRQQSIAKKPRNKNYDEAMRIAKATWNKYPAASKGQMCKNISKHFNGGVSVDRLDAWIKEAGIQPPRPKKHTSFALVI